MRLQRFEIKGIGRVPWDETMFLGTVLFQFVTGEDINELGHEISIIVRVRHEATATFESLEKKLFEEAAGLLDQGSRFVAKETFESLRQSTLVSEREKMAAHRDRMPDTDPLATTKNSY
jgi:hypothetical protein